MNRPRLLPWLIAVVPVAVAVLSLRPSDVATGGAVLNALGRLAGIGGLAFLLVAAGLSCRVPGFDRPFGGLTKLWQTHHKLGGTALLLVLAHPVLLALGAAEVSIVAAARTLVAEPLTPSTVWGWIALLVMIVFLAPSFAFFGQPEYQRWRNLHRLAGVAVVGALSHMVLVARTIAEPLSILLWALLATSAVAAVAWRLVFSRRVGRLRYTVDGISRPANNVVELSLAPRGAALTYEPGQFVYLTPYDPALSAGHGEEHPYTLSSSPTEDRLRVVIKDLGDASRAIQRIEAGTEVRIEGPYGAFFPTRHTGVPELWIAGGIGITPFLGRARHLAAMVAGGAAPADVDLIYCVQDESRAHFLDELGQLAERAIGLRITMHYFYREGVLNSEFLARHCPDRAARTVYVCGPVPLMDRAKELLAAAGVPRTRMHTEEFTLL